jgi:hypothetical protein
VVHVETTKLRGRRKTSELKYSEGDFFSQQHSDESFNFEFQNVTSEWL